MYDSFSARTVLLLLGVVALAAHSPAAPAEVVNGPGGGEFVIGPQDYLSEGHRREIKKRIDRNISILRAEGKLRDVREAGVLFQWPVRAAGGLSVFDFHGISNFVDQNPSYPNLLLDYACGARTYDLANSYNHRGTDIFTWPFPWLRMANDQIEVVAAAAGTIILKQDGYYDRSCSLSSEPWNAVYVRHADGSVAWYGHLKVGSQTTKLIGDPVEAGDYLGVVGSSGSSTGPHLHFEVWDAFDNLIDPFQGACNSLNPDSWWADQRAYYDSAVNQITTGRLAPDFGSCPSPETTHAQSAFDPGALIYFTTYYHDQRSGQTSQYSIHRPDGSTYTSWTHSTTESHYAASYWYWWINFPASAPSGTWRFDVQYQGRWYRHYFAMGSSFGAGGIPDDAPLTMDRAADGDLHLSWGASCLFSDQDYEIYEGTLGAYDSHHRLHCTTAALTSKTITPASNDTYYLVVPRNTAHEGSYGNDSDGVPRPAAVDACVPQVVDVCP
jgi:murein DD-endopeptidase MepM/ murein hydrolase activator NlpD